jgi:hypothetical protein
MFKENDKVCLVRKPVGGWRHGAQDLKESAFRKKEVLYFQSAVAEDEANYYGESAVRLYTSKARQLTVPLSCIVSTTKPLFVIRRKHVKCH